MRSLTAPRPCCALPSPLPDAWEARPARATWAQAGVPFVLATCGWVLGPPSDRTLFDRALPKVVAASCINREVGKAPVDPMFARIGVRSKWASPSLERETP